MTAADRSRSTADKFRLSRPASDPAEDAASSEDDPQVSAKVRVKEIRGSYDLPPARYRAVGRWCADAADELGEVRIARSDMVLALIQLLLTDETLSRRVKAALPGVIKR